MKKIYVLLMLVAGFSATRLTAQWTNIGTSGFSPGQASSISFALDTNGTPYVAFQDNDSSSKISVMKFTGGSWSLVGARGFSPYEADYVSLAMAADGTPYVGFSDNGGNGSGPGSKQVIVMKYNGSTWVNVGAPDFSAVEADFISLAFDHNGVLYVAYYDNATFSPTIKKFNGSAWVDVGIQITTSISANDISLAIDNNNVPLVAFSDGSTGHKASVIKYNGSTWVNVGAAGFTPDAAYYTSLTIAPDGTPYIAFEDANDTLKASVMKFNGSNWVFVGAEGFSIGEQVQFLDIAIDPCGTPYVTYQDNGTIDYSNITVNKFNGSNWVIVGQAAFSTSGSAYNNIVLDKFGTPMVAYQDVEYSNKVSVEIFPTLAGIPSVAASNTTICSGGAATLSISSGNLNQASNWHWYSTSCGGTPAGTGTSVQVSPTNSTTYYVRGEGTCVASSCANIQITVNTCNGIAGVDANDLKLYPNPAGEQVTLEGDILSGGNYQLIISDITGRLVAPDFKRGTNTAVINTSSLSPGIYLVSLKTGDNTISKKLIKE